MFINFSRIRQHGAYVLCNYVTQERYLHVHFGYKLKNCFAIDGADFFFIEFSGYTQLLFNAVFLRDLSDHVALLISLLSAYYMRSCER